MFVFKGRLQEQLPFFKYYLGEIHVTIYNQSQERLKSDVPTPSC